MPEDIERIVQGLFEGMRAMLRHAQPYLDDHPRCWGRENTKQALRARGLAHGEFAYLTPLGKEVRQHLLSTPLQQDSQP